MIFLTRFCLISKEKEYLFTFEFTRTEHALELKATNEGGNDRFIYLRPAGLVGE